jgi:hypothetical protein
VTVRPVDTRQGLVVSEILLVYHLSELERKIGEAVELCLADNIVNVRIERAKKFVDGVGGHVCGAAYVLQRDEWFCCVGSERGNVVVAKDFGNKRLIRVQQGYGYEGEVKVRSPLDSASLYIECEKVTRASSRLVLYKSKSLNFGYTLERKA